jgi:hypothetical protein
MISTLLATVAVSQTSHLSFTMILVAGNERPIVEMKDLDDSSSDKVTAAIQKLTHRFEAEKHSFMLLDGGKIADQIPNHLEPTIFMLGKTYSPGKEISEYIIQNGKKVHMTGYQSETRGTISTKMRVPQQDRVYGAGFINSMMGEKSESLFLSSLGTLLLVNKDDRPEYVDYYPNQLALSRHSVEETVEWLRVNSGKYKPSLVLCSKGRPQKGDDGLLAFPPAGVILTYQVTFDKRWSAKLKDIIRVH